MSEIFAGQLTAVANVVLAAFAIVTAILAGLAFLKQSREVRDQAEMLRIQAEQLGEQRKINELQAEDLRESLRERIRLRQVAERQQADQILFWMSSTWLPAIPEKIARSGFSSPSTTAVHMAVIVNESRRPIQNVVCRISAASDLEKNSPPSPGESGFAILIGQLPVTGFGSHPDSDSLKNLTLPYPEFRIRPGETFGFLFAIDSHQPLRELAFLVAVRFTDDTDVNWQIEDDGHLKQISDRNW